MSIPVSIDGVSPLKLYLLGAPEIAYAAPLPVQQMPTKARAVLFYLAMTGRTHTREALAHLLWSEHGEEEARRNLRKIIQALREQLDPFLAIDHHTVSFHSPTAYWVDAGEFAAAVPGQVQDAQAANLERLQASLVLYRADFLEGFYVRDAPLFESWMLAERARLRELMLGRLAMVGEGHAAAGNLPHAIGAFRRLVELEPWREEAHRWLMHLLAQNGQRSAALVQYDLCCRALAEELGVEPDEDTRALHASLLQPAAPAVQRAPQSPHEPHHQALPPLSPPPPLPVATVDFPLVGRKVEFQSLLSTWTRTVQSGTQMVFVAGEAGIGKTRLAEELLLHVQRQGHVAVRARAYALEGRLAYAPLADWLRAPPLQARLETLDQVWLRELSRLLPELLIQHPDLPPPEPLTERWQQKRLFEALRNAFTAGSRPLLLLLDDLQWCDAETLAWLQYLVETAPQAPLLVVGTVRSDEIDDEHPLHQLRRALLRAGKLFTVDLVPLSAEDTAALGAEVWEYALDSVTAASLFEATAGNPLYVVETVRAGNKFVTPDDKPSDHIGPPTLQPGAGLPPKVYALIEARLAQLTPATRTLAQVAATIGRAFTLPLLAEAGRVDEESVVAGLDELWRRRIVREQASTRYDFTHDRIRDVAFATISPVKRAHLHRRVAQALEKLHSDDLDPLAGELGMHYQGVSAWEPASGYFRQAATVARQLYAHSDEVYYLQQAIAAVQMLPPNVQTCAVEIELWHELGFAQALVHGWGSGLAAAAWEKAAELAELAGYLRQRCQAIDWLSLVSRNRGEWHKVRTLDKLTVSLAQEIGDLQLLKGLSADQGSTMYQFGEFAPALALLKQHPAFSAQPELFAHACANEEIAEITAFSVIDCLWLLGFPDQALAYGNQMLAFRHMATHFTTRCAMLAFLGVFYSYLRASPMVQKLAEELAAVSTDYDFPFFGTESHILLGWALAQQGAVHEGLSLVREGTEDQRRLGIRMIEPFHRSLLAETLALAGEWEEALDEVTAALAYAEECGNVFWNAHLLKLQGDYMQALSLSTEEVEACYQRAIATAQHQGAKSLELRATTALCRLWQRQGKSGEAYTLLSAIYGWFTEGFDTIDLREAQDLLDQLQAPITGS